MLASAIEYGLDGLRKVIVCVHVFVCVRTLVMDHQYVSMCVCMYMYCVYCMFVMVSKIYLVHNTKLGNCDTGQHVNNY